MPAAPRCNKKATKIAYKVLGKPANLDFKQSSIQKKVEKQLTEQNTARVR